MAVAPTGAIYKALEFDGVSSRTYGVYITGEAVYNAPERDVEMITIPGRSGSFALDNGRFENITVTYPAGIFAETEADFREAISEFRNFLCSRKGYVRLQDEYNPNEYRMAVYKSGLEVEPAMLKAGEFEITFDCKPQRWLVSGETAVTIGEWGETETATGDIVTVENEDGILGVKSLSVALDPIQDLHGYDKPWSGGNGKNKLPSIDATFTSNGVTWTLNDDGSIKLSGTATSNSLYDFGRNIVELDAGTYFANETTNGYVVTIFSIVDGTASVLKSGGGSFTLTEKTSVFMRVVVTNGTAINTTLFPQIEKSASFTSYEPYSNICPISGRTEVETIVSPTTSAEDGTTYTTDLGQTVYGGTLDVMSGELVVDRAMVDLGTLNWTYWSNLGGFSAQLTPLGKDKFNAVCSAYPYGGAYSDLQDKMCGYVYNNQAFVKDGDYTDATAFTSAVTGQTLCYELATPTTYQLTPTEVALLLGNNNVWSEDGEVTVEYGQLPNLLINPTLFESGPLLEIEGYGKVDIDGQEIEFLDIPLGEVQLSEDTPKFTPLNVTYSFTIDTANLIVGDRIYAKGSGNIRLGITRIYGMGATISSATVTNSTNCVSATCTVYDANKSASFNLGPNLTGGYIYGTASTITASMTINVVHSQGTFNVVLTCNYAYDGANTITFSRSMTGVNTTYFSTITSQASWLPAFYGDSSKSAVINPRYLDLDIGEAYAYSGGVLLPLNNTVSIPAKLPTLAPGSNTITFDNTITDLKVVPRWWRV